MTNEQPRILDNPYHTMNPRGRIGLIGSILTQQQTPQNPLDSLLVLGSEISDRPQTLRQILALEAAIGWNRTDDIDPDLFEVVYYLGRDAIEFGQGFGISLDWTLQQAAEKLMQFDSPQLLQQTKNTLRYLRNIENHAALKDPKTKKETIEVIKAKSFLRNSFGQEGEGWSEIRDNLKNRISGDIPAERIQSAAQVVGGRVLETNYAGYTAIEPRTMDTAFAPGITPNCQEEVYALQQILGGGQPVYFYIEFPGKIAPHVIYQYGDWIIPYGSIYAIHKSKWVNMFKCIFGTYTGKPILERTTAQQLGFTDDEILRIGSRIIEI